MQVSIKPLGTAQALSKGSLHENTYGVHNLLFLRVFDKKHVTF